MTVTPVTCKECDQDLVAGKCPHCGEEPEDMDSALDRLVSRASIPSLGSLITKAKEKGWVQPQTDYAHAS